MGDVFRSFLLTERDRVHEAALERCRLLAEELSGVDWTGLTELLLRRRGAVIGGRLRLAGHVLVFVDEIVNAPRHDGAQWTQSRRRQLVEWRHQLSVAHRQRQKLQVHVPFLAALVAVVHRVQSVDI